MTAFFSKLFNVRADEWPRLMILYVMALVALMGINWGEAIVQAAFLQRVGVQFLPWVFIGSAACSTVAIFIYGAFADRVPNDRLLIGILGLSAATIACGLLFLARGAFGLAYSLLYLVLNVPLLDVYNIHWATYVNGFYDIRAAKRIVPLLGTASRVAGIVAGLSMPLLNRLLSPGAIILVWLLALLAMAGLVQGMPRLLKEQTAGGVRAATAEAAGATGSTAAAYRANLREGYNFVTRSSFLRWMAAATLALIMLVTFLNYRASSIFVAQLKTTVAISDFVGLLNGVANLALLPLQLFLLSRLIGSLGLADASLIYPGMTLLFSSAVSFVPSLATAGLAYVDYTTLRAAFRNPIENLLYNAVPLRVKGRARAFIGGLLVPVGAILAGLLLLTPLVKTVWFLPAAIILASVVFLAISMGLRKHYGQALVTMLEQEDFSSLTLQAPSTLTVTDPATLESLRKRLVESSSPEFTVFMANLIAEIGGAGAAPILSQLARSAENGRTRAAVVSALAATEVRTPAAYNLYDELLADGDPRVRQAALAGLEQISPPNDRQFLDKALALAADPEPEVRARVLPILLAAADPGYRAAAGETLRLMLAAPEGTERQSALHILGQGGDVWRLPDVLAHLADPQDAVRLEAALAAEKLTARINGARNGALPGLFEAAHGLLDDPVERARVAAVTVLGRVGSQAAQQALVESLGDPSPEVRAAAVAALVSEGRPVVPIVHPELNAADPLVRKTAAVALARIEPREYAPLIRGPDITGNLLTIYRNIGLIEALSACSAYRSVAILQATLHEQNQSLLDEIFYLLSAVEDPGAIRVIRESFGSAQAQVRASAAEALESMTTPQTANLILPLFEPTAGPTQLLGLSREAWGMHAPSPQDALRQLAADPQDPWLRAISAAALREMRSQDGLGEGTLLSIVEKVIFLKEVPFFEGMTIDQLKILAGVCEEEFFAEGAHIFGQGDPGGTLYVVVSGRVGIEQERRKGSSARLAEISAHSYFGEMNLFDNSPRSSAAIAVRDTLTLRLRREPLIALARQHPDLSLELINVLTERLREANDRIADLTRSRPRELHRLYDAFEEG